jgi:hypothetical protein
MGSFLFRLLRIQETMKVIKVMVNKTLKNISTEVTSGHDMSDLLLPLNSRSCSCKCKASQYGLPIAAHLRVLNVYGRPSHDAPHCEPENLEDDLGYQNNNAIAKPRIGPDSDNVQRTDDDRGEALCCR